MQHHHLEALVPDYQGLEWQELNLPKQACPWQAQLASDVATQSDDSEHHVIHEDNWRWPKKDIVVFTDLHADGHAFVNSLVASGYIYKHGPRDDEFKITKRGKKCLFIINGDCFDKGPSNLHLLRLMHQLIKQKAKIKIIAGNHDIRFAIGVRSLKQHDNPLMSHLFLRMAPKGASFFKEIYNEYVMNMSYSEREKLGESLSEDEVRSKLYPDSYWEIQFRRAAQSLIKDAKIEKEIKNIKEKIKRFESRLQELNMTLQMVYAAIRKWQELFLTSNGEFSWFFRKMKLLYACNSFLFMHAGIDDEMAKRLKRYGAKNLNKKFHKTLQKNPFELYFGPMGNIFRTKYRENDHEFTKVGARVLKNCGYKAIVQGHCNRYHGQQLVVRHGLLNFECDASLDALTRTKEGLSGRGAAATIIKKSGMVLGVSVDYPFVKVYVPEAELENHKLQ